MSKPVTRLFIHRDFASLHQTLSATHYKVYAPNSADSKLQAIRKTAIQIHGEEEGRRLLDGLVVLSAPKKNFSECPVHLLVGEDTSLASFQEDRVATELRLKESIYSTNAQQQQPFKLSCAACMLHVEPNGFLCIESTSLDAMGAIRDLAQATAAGATEQHKHADHSDFVAVISKRKLRAVKNVRTPMGKNLAKTALWKELESQGIQDTNNEGGEKPDFVLNHHLSSLLGLRQTKNEGEDDVHWLVMGYYSDWGLDLPGGKRHLGETSWEGAVRETREEISLSIDDSWNVKDTAAEECNVYYVLDPLDRIQA